MEFCEVEEEEEEEEGDQDDVTHHLNCILKRMERIDQANQRKNAKYEEVCDLAETQQEILLKQLTTLLEDLREREAIKTKLYEVECQSNQRLCEMLEQAQ